MLWCHLRRSWVWLGKLKYTGDLQGWNSKLLQVGLQIVSLIHVLGAVHKWRLQALPPPYVVNNDVCRWYSTGGPQKNDCRWNSLILHSISRYLMSKVAIPIISCSCDEQKLKKLFHLEHSHIRNDDGAWGLSNNDVCRRRGVGVWKDPK